MPANSGASDRSGEDRADCSPLRRHNDEGDASEDETCSEADHEIPDCHNDDDHPDCNVFEARDSTMSIPYGLEWILNELGNAAKRPENEETNLFDEIDT